MRKMKRVATRLWPVIALLLVVGVIGCSDEDGAGWGPRTPRLFWVACEPIQCLGNPWEQDWLERHGWDYGAYPKDPATVGLEPEEIAIIKDYYRRLGVMVHEVESRMKYDQVCAACSCPEGHTLYLMVPQRDVELTLSWGYRLEAP
jgi:hypothetical protein